MPKYGKTLLLFAILKKFCIFVIIINQEAMKNCKGQELPQPYYDLAEMRRDQKCGVKDVTIMLSSAFNWATTLEGYDWWSSVFKGNKPSIHYASLAELDEWRKAKATISKMGTVEPGYKAKYEAEKEMAEYYENQYNVLKDAIITPTAEPQSPDRNWVAECAMAVYANSGMNLYDGITESWKFAQKWAAEGKKRGYIG